MTTKIKVQIVEPNKPVICTPQYNADGKWKDMTDYRVTLADFGSGAEFYLHPNQRIYINELEESTSDTSNKGDKL